MTWPWHGMPKQEQQQLLEQENAALAQELFSLNKSARGVEATMRELATLNQMFSTQVRAGDMQYITSCNTPTACVLG